MQDVDWEEFRHPGRRYVKVSSISSGNEGKKKGKCGLKWRTVNCPGCGEKLRLWWVARSRRAKQFLCRDCRTLFWMDRGGNIQGDMYAVSEEDAAAVEKYVVRFLEGRAL